MSGRDGREIQNGQEGRDAETDGGAQKRAGRIVRELRRTDSSARAAQAPRRAGVAASIIPPQPLPPTQPPKLAQNTKPTRPARAGTTSSPSPSSAARLGATQRQHPRTARADRTSRITQQPASIPGVADVRDFAAFERWVRGLLQPQRGPAWERFVEAYLCLTPALGIVDVWRPADPYLPDDVLAQLGLERQDVGQDFVARTTSGALWVVQAKFRSSAGTLTWEDVRGAVAAGRRADRVLIVSNASAISGNAPRGLMNHHVGTAMRQELLSLDVEFFAAWEAVRAGRRPPTTGGDAVAARRPYQQDAVGDVVRTFQEGARRAQLIAACGTGKTRMGLWVLEDLDVERALFFAPSLALVSQTVAEWTSAAVRPIDVICVCSDPDAGDMSAYELAVPVTTSAAALRSQCKAPLPAGHRRVIFATYHSAAVVQTALAPAPADGAAGAVALRPDLMVCDEAHRVAGDQDKAWQLVLDNEAIACPRRLFLTATPRTVSPELKAAGVGACMDDAELFGRVAHRISFRDAINLGILADYRIHVIGVPTDDRRAKTLVQRRAYVLDAGGDQRPYDAGEIAQALALEQALTQGLFHYAFTFHSRVSYAKRFIAATEHVWRPAVREQTAFCVITGEHPLRERRAMLKRAFARPHAVVGSVKALSEGVDVPAVDAVVFADPKESVIDIVQGIGRALRKRPGAATKTASIVIPVPVPAGTDPAETITGTAWRTVWNVIEAMSEHDGELEEHLAVLRTELGQRHTRRSSSPAVDVARAYLEQHVTVHLPVGARFEVLKQAVRLAVVDRGTWAFWHMLGVYRSWSESHPSQIVGQDTVGPAGERLRAWVNDVRAKYRARLLPEAHVAALNATPGWCWDAALEKWLEQCHRIAAIVARVGGLPSSLLAIDDANEEAVKWLGKQRDALAAGALDEPRLAALRALPGWTDRESDAEFEVYAGAAAALAVGKGSFEQWVSEQTGRAKGYRAAATGYSVVRRASTHAATTDAVSAVRARLNTWIKQQRELLRNGTLTRERVERLSAIPGWVWDPAAVAAEAREEKRRSLLAQVAAFVENHGVAPGAAGAPPADKELRQGVSTVRYQHRNGTLDPELQAAFEAMPGWEWNAGLTAFRAIIEKARPIVAEHYGGWVPTDFVSEDGTPIGRWLTEQRAARAADRLDQERIALLESLPGWNWRTGEVFARNVEALRRLLQAQPSRDLSLPMTVELGGQQINLGEWMCRTATRYRDGKLTDEEIGVLESIPAWRWDRLTDAQERAITMLAEYLDRRGWFPTEEELKCPTTIGERETSDDAVVHQWLRSQRRAAAEDRLPEKLRGRLRQFAGWDSFVATLGDERKRTTHRLWRSRAARLEPLDDGTSFTEDEIQHINVFALARLELVRITTQHSRGEDVLCGGRIVARPIAGGYPDYGIVWRAVTVMVPARYGGDPDAPARAAHLRAVLGDLEARGELRVYHDLETTASHGRPGVRVTEWWISADWASHRDAPPTELLKTGKRVAAEVERAMAAAAATAGAEANPEADSRGEVGALAEPSDDAVGNRALEVRTAP